jgi:hypothetical protein
MFLGANIIVIMFFFFFFFFFMSTQEEGGEIQISDIRFMRRGPQPIEIPLGDGVMLFNRWLNYRHTIEIT